MVVLLFVNCVPAQLKPNSLEPLLGRISDGSIVSPQDTLRSISYAQKCLAQARATADYEHTALAYKALLYLSEKKYQLAYSDSMLVAAQTAKDNRLIGSVYVTKATLYYGRKEPTQALDYYIKADDYLSKTTDTYSIYKVKYGIAQLKYYLGFYDEAISLFRECIDYFKEENERAYLNSLHCLGLCYNRIGNYEWCTLVNQMGIDEGERLSTSEMVFYFIHSEGINQCGKGRYPEAITKLKRALPEIIRVKDFANESVAYFYIGKSYWSLKQPEQAVVYFKKMAALFEKKQYIRPDLREGYECLIDYYKAHDDTQLQLYYINQLLAVDRILERNYTYLVKKIVKDYDIKELYKAKEELTTTMACRTSIGFVLLFIMMLLVAYLCYRNYRNKKLFEALMQRPEEKTPLPKNSSRSASFDLSPELETGILKKLEHFERQKKYLEKDMTLVKMAALLHTNTKYVTKIIAKHRDKGTVEYITYLKIEHILTLLKQENKYRHYTNKALGEEAGFGSTQNFTKAFIAQTGISPTYFSSQLKKTGVAAAPPEVACDSK
jgi:tetratricopeptide (TPR) repeat protein